MGEKEREMVDGVLVKLSIGVFSGKKKRIFIRLV